MSRSGSRARRRRQAMAEKAQGPKGGRPRLEQVDANTFTWIPEGIECEALWMDVIVHPQLGIPCVGISLGNSAYVLVPIEQAFPLLVATVQNIQAAAAVAQATSPIVGPDGRPLVQS